MTPDTRLRTDAAREPQPDCGQVIPPELLEVLARATTPAERIGGGWLLPSGDSSATADERLGRWSSLVANGRPERIARILTDRGITADEWRTGLGEAHPVPGAPMPEWARDAADLLSMVEGTDAETFDPPTIGEVAGAGLPDWVDPADPWRFYPGFRDWLDHGARRVDHWADAFGAPVLAAARRDLVINLARRLLGVSGPLLMELAAQLPPDEQLFAEDPRDTWLGIWRRYPVVARLMATTWAQWAEVTEELLSRLAADLPTIRPGTAVSELKLGAGDQHSGGRGVAVIHLSDDSVLFYKPRADGIHLVLRRLLDLVEAAGNPIGLQLPQVIDRPGYVWVPEVQRQDCADTEAVAEYFYRAGALLRILQAVGATDLHHENFIPSAQGPVLVDLETVFAPGQWQRGSAAKPVEPALAAALRDTPGPTSMVGSPVDGPPGRASADIGALAGPSECLTPYEVRSLVRTEAGPQLLLRRLPMTNGAALPTLDGSPVALRGYEDSLIAGFEEAHRRLLSLPDLSSQLAKDAAQPEVRFVPRATNIYARLLSQSLAPASLVDGIERELVLERLWRAVGTAPAALIEAEQSSLRELDIPLFVVPFDSTDLISDHGATITDAHASSPLAMTQSRLLTVGSREDYPDDLRAAVFAVDPVDAAENTEPGSNPAPSTTPADRPLPRFDEAAEILLDRAVSLSDGTVTWVGLDYDPTRYRWRSGRLGPGLLGDAGIGLLLASLAALDPAAPAGCAEVARAALQGSVNRSIAPPEAWAGSDAFTGPAGVLYAVAKAASLLDDPVLLAAAISLATPTLLAARSSIPSYGMDAVSGAVLAFLQLPEHGGARQLETIAELAHLLAVSAGTPPSSGQDPARAWSFAMPSAAAGTLLACRRLTSTLPLLAGEAGVPTIIQPSLNLAAVGDVQALAAIGVEPSDQTWSSLTDRTGSAQTLLDRAEIARTATQHSDDPIWSTRLAEAKRALTLRRVRTGHWNGQIQAPDSRFLSAIHGLAAFGMLGVADHLDSPNVRVLS